MASGHTARGFRSFHIGGSSQNQATSLGTQQNNSCNSTSSRTDTKWNVSDAGLKKLAQKPKSQFPDEFTGQSGGPAKRQLKLPFQFDLWG